MAIRLIPESKVFSRGYVLKFDDDHVSDKFIDNLLTTITTKKLLDRYNYFFEVNPIKNETVSDEMYGDINYFPNEKSLKSDTNILFFEIDVIKKNSMDNNYEICKEYLEKFKQHMPEPSCVVFSGYGLHIYYKLNKFYDYHKLNDVCKKYVNYDKYSGKIINAGSTIYTPVPRLRLPNTYNRKIDYKNNINVIQSKFMYVNKNRYDLSNIIDALSNITNQRYINGDDLESINSLKENHIGDNEISKLNGPYDYIDYMENPLKYFNSDIDQNYRNITVKLCKKYQKKLKGGIEKLEELLTLIGYPYDHKGKFLKINTYSLDDHGGSQPLLIYPNKSIANSICHYPSKDSDDVTCLLYLLFKYDMESFNKIMKHEGYYSEFYKEYSLAFHEEMYGIEIPKHAFRAKNIEIDPNISKADLISLIDNVKSYDNVIIPHISQEYEMNAEKYWKVYYQKTPFEEWKLKYDEIDLCVNQALSFHTDDIEILKIDQYIPVDKLEYVFDKIDEKCKINKKKYA